MKKLICSTVLLVLSVSSSAVTISSPNSNSTEKQRADIGITAPPDSSTSRSGMSNSSGITTDDMNTAPNPAPATEDDLLRDTTLTEGMPETDPSRPEGKGMEAQQDENALDYSTTPKHQEEVPSTKPNPNKIGN